MQHKYRIEIGLSQWQHRLHIGFYGLAMVSILLWPLVWSWQWLLQLLVAVVIVYLAVGYSKTWQTEQLKWPFIQLQDSGELELLQQQQQLWLEAKVTSRSVSCDWFCLLVLERELLVGKKQFIRLWIFRDSVDDNSYRRLCRVIHRIRSGG